MRVPPNLFLFSFFSPAAHKLVSPDLCLNLGASKAFTTSLLYAQQCSVRQPGSQINPHYGNSENYKGNDDCLERNVIMRLDLSTWPLVRFLLKVQLSVFCLSWQHHYRLSGNLILQAEDRLTLESAGILHPYLQEHNSDCSLTLVRLLCITHRWLLLNAGGKAQMQLRTESNSDCMQGFKGLKAAASSTSWLYRVYNLSSFCLTLSNLADGKLTARGQVKVCEKKHYA